MPKLLLFPFTTRKQFARKHFQKIPRNAILRVAGVEKLVICCFNSYYFFRYRQRHMDFINQVDHEVNGRKTGAVRRPRSVGSWHQALQRAEELPLQQIQATARDFRRLPFLPAQL